MDLLHRCLGHESASTRELFALCRPLTDDERDRFLMIDHGTLRSTCTYLRIANKTEV